MFLFFNNSLKVFFKNQFYLQLKKQKKLLWFY